MLKLEITGTDVFGEESFQIELSHNFKTVLFTNGSQRYLYTATVEGDKVKFVARRVPHLSKGFKILHFCEDLNNEGFFAVCVKDFDKKIRLMHTHRKKFKVA